MHNRTIMATLFALGLVVWAGLLLFMNQKPPDLANQVLFLIMWGMAVSFTMVPISYAAAARATAYSHRRRDLNVAIRRGLLIGVVAVLLMALRFLRLLTPTTALTLILLTVALEVLLSLRER
ncbi:MAG: hypothetical protein FJZ90_18150 [Chloroflexi bacterium]|nr:hypothetical protein [Chloroflexota bacterium]